MARDAPRKRVTRGKRTARTDVAGSGRRMVVGRYLLVIALVAAGVKLVIVQGFEAQALSKKAEEQTITKQIVHAERGTIMDSNGRVLAFSSEARKLYATPTRLKREQREARVDNPSAPTGAAKKREIAAFIDRVTNGKVSEKTALDALFSGEQFLYFGPLIDPGAARKITKKYSQIGAEFRATRQYPAGVLAANIIGAATWRMDQQKIRGRFGLENSLNKVLAGENGVRIARTGRGSSLVIPGTEKTLKPAEPGSDVKLTIDSDLQYKLQTKLADYVAKLGAQGGSAVVLDAQTGEVRALANDRTFDPANPKTWTPENISNPAVTTPYEPGSVNKVITAAGAIEHGIVKPDTVLQVPGQIRMGGVTVKDAWSHGTVPLTFTGVLAKSSNVGTLKVAQKLGKERFSDLVHKFGVGRKTGIALPGESAGYVPPRKQWSNSTFANLPIGQGLSMTVLQMAGMYQAIANDGVRVPPRVIAATVKPDGTKVPHPRPDGVRVVSKKTADTVTSMLRATFQDAPGQSGTAQGAAVTGYQIAGKTGTAQQVDPACNCYSNSKYWVTFAGIVPANNPRFVVGIMIDAPANGSHTAAPLFHDVAQYLTQRYDIPVSKKPAPTQTLRVRE